jgi:hypothetical protein
MAGFAAASPDARERVRSLYAPAAPVTALLVASPHLYWLSGGHFDLVAAGYDVGVVEAVIHWTRLIAKLAFEHAGLLVLVVVAGALFVDRKVAVPAIERPPIDPFARQFVYVFALAPAMVAAVIAALRGQPAPLGGYGALVVLSGLAVIVAAGEVILTVNEPADIGRFFGETFERRTGRPLEIVVGDPRLGALVALGAPGRPSLYVDASHERAPWVTDAAVLTKGAIVVWPAADTAGAPPPDIRARFPDMVAEVPRAFERPLQGRLPLFRVGWGMIRPQAQ